MQAATANAVKVTNDKFADYSLTSHTHSDYVLTSRTVAGQALTADVTAATISSAIGLDRYLTAVPSDYKTYAATLSSLSSDYSLTSHTHSEYVPTSRTVAGQALTADVTAGTISSAIGLNNYYGKSETSSAAQISAADYALSSEISAKTAISVDGEFTDEFKFEHISLDEYIAKHISGVIDGNTMYDISSENMTVFGGKIVDLAPGEDPTDAVNLEQLAEVSSRAYDTYTKVETD